MDFLRLLLDRLKRAVFFFLYIFFSPLFSLPFALPALLIYIYTLYIFSFSLCVFFPPSPLSFPSSSAPPPRSFPSSRSRRRSARIGSTSPWLSIASSCTSSSPSRQQAPSGFSSMRRTSLSTSIKTRSFKCIDGRPAKAFSLLPLLPSFLSLSLSLYLTVSLSFLILNFI